MSARAVECRVASRFILNEFSFLRLLRWRNAIDIRLFLLFVLRPSMVASDMWFKFEWKKSENKEFQRTNEEKFK